MTHGELIMAGVVLFTAVLFFSLGASVTYRLMNGKPPIVKWVSRDKEEITDEQTV